MSNSSDTIGCGWALLICLMLVIGATGSVFSLNNLSWQNTAIEEGHAEYYLDENHERQWRWKDCK